MKKILVTGCNGQLGREINRIYKSSSEYEIFNTDVACESAVKLDITNVDQVLELVREVKPYAIINCAAHTGWMHVRQIRIMPIASMQSVLEI